MTTATRPTAERKRIAHTGSVSKSQVALRAIDAMARRSGAGGKLPTVVELRNDLNVSLSTLNTALDELERQQVIVRRHGSGIYVAPNVGKRLIAVVCDPRHFRNAGSSPFWDTLLRYVTTRAQSHDEILDMHYGTLTGNECMLPSTLTTDIESGRVSGVLSIGHFDDGIWLDVKGIPVVTYAGFGMHMVRADDAQLVRLGAEALMQRGCKRLGLVSSLSTGVSMRQHEFRQELMNGGLEYDASLLRQANPAMGAHTSRQEQGYVFGQQLFALPKAQRPDGILSTEDMLTLGLLCAAREMGIEIGQNLWVASHANVGSPALLGWKDCVISIEVDPAQIVELMFSQLERLMNGQTDVEELVVTNYTMQSPLA